MRTWWRSRSERERRVVRAGAVLAAVAIVGAFWLQAERSRARLAQELPQLRASIAALERSAAEVARLRALPAAASLVPSAPLASLATDAGGVPGARITVLDERRVRLEGGDVSFTALLDWLRLAQARHGMRVEAARLQMLAAPGRVEAELVLARP
jgi:type II secretory pathway component PulM